MTIIHTFLYDSDFLNKSSITDSYFKSGGQCVPSEKALSYFVTPDEIPDERTTRGTSLNVPLTAVPKLLVDGSISGPGTLITDIANGNLWTQTNRYNLFSIIDYLLFAYNANATSEQIELGLSAWPEYLANSLVYSTTKTTASAYLTTTQSITVPDYVTFTFVSSASTQYEIRVWANNTLFLAQYPISTIAVVVPPIPLAQLYTLDLVSGISNVFATALSTAALSQTTLSNYIQSGEYSGFVGQDVTFYDTNNNTAVVQFNILYNGAVPGVIAVRTAIRNLLLNSGVGNTAGWQAKAPVLFVSELWYLVPLWNNITNQISSNVYPNIVSTTKAGTDVTTVLYDVISEFVTDNLDLVTSYYNNITVGAVPDTENSEDSLSLAAVHPTYQVIPPTNPAFNYQAANTQTFSSLLAAALAVAAGNPNSNGSLTVFTAPGDNRTWVTFSVGEIEYYVLYQSSYNTLVAS